MDIKALRLPGILLVLFVTVAGFSMMSPNDHFDGKKFFNPGAEPIQHGFSSFLKFFLHHREDSWPDHVENKVKPDLPKNLKPQEVAITFINHATLLIQTQKLNILTDPIWSERASPFSWIGPKRVREPGVAFSELPHIDIVIISHNHYDHMDLPTLHMLSDRDQPQIFVPFGDQEFLTKEGIKNVQEHDWWETTMLDSAKVTFTPSQHFAARGIFDRNETLWGSYFLEINGIKIYFAGDTGYGPHFKEIHSRLGRPLIALLPIGAYEPRWFMKPMHMNPEEAVQANLDLEAGKMIPMHFGTFHMSDEGIDQPLIDLKSAFDKHRLQSNDYQILDEGQTRIFDLDAKDQPK